MDLRLQDAYADLVRDGLDLAVRIGPLQDSRLVARRIDWQQLVCVASPAYLASRGMPVRLDELARHDAVAYRLPSSGRTRPWQLREGRRAIELPMAHRVQVNDGEGMVEAELLGLGLMQIADYMVADELACGTLVEVLASRRPAPMPANAVLPSTRLLPPRVRVVLEALLGLRERHAP